MDVFLKIDNSENDAGIMRLDSGIASWLCDRGLGLCWELWIEDNYLKGYRFSFDDMDAALMFKLTFGGQ